MERAQAAVAPDVMSVDEAAATYGFETIKTEFIAEYNSHATLFRHTKTGAELMSLVNDDENKTFGAVFRTPPANSTGTSPSTRVLLCVLRRRPPRLHGSGNPCQHSQSCGLWVSERAIALPSPRRGFEAGV